MPSIKTDSLSAFGRLALQLDNDFTELNRLSGQLQRLDIDSESGLEHAVKVLNQFAQHGTSISNGIQDFSRVLQEARAKSEEAAKAVGDRAQEIYLRKQQQNQIREELGKVEANVKAVNARLSGFKKEGRSEFSDKEKIQLREELERINVDLKKYLAEVQAIKTAASAAKFKSVERDAQGLLDALRASSRRVDKVTA